MAANPSTRRRLLEREGELAALRAALDEARAGRGSALLVEGPPGIGKSELLAAAGRAAEREARVLRGGGGELERDFPFGVVRQLLEPALASAGRAALLSGAAALATPLFEQAAPVAGAEAEPAMLHGLFWLVAGLAEQRPLVLLVDDLHWCDPPSLRFLAYLARRLDAVGALLVGAVRPPGAAPVEEPALRVLRERPEITRLRPRLLSRAAVAELVADAWGAPDDAAATAVHDACGGNPLLVRELLATAASADAAQREIALARGTPELGELVSQRLRAAGDAPAAFARAVAVLGDRATVRLAAELAGLPPATADEAERTLRALGVVTGDAPLAFTHPVVRSAVYGAMGTLAREALHARAARLLAATGVRPELVVVHLVEAGPRLDPEGIAALREAARRARAEGAADTAAHYLRRLLREPLGEKERAEVLVDLGRAESRTDPQAAARHIAEALELSGEPRAHAAVAVELAEAFFAIGRGSEALEPLSRALDRLGPAHDDLALRVEAELIALARFDPEHYGRAHRRLAALAVPEPAGPGGAHLLALRASDLARAGRDRQTAIELASRALAGAGAAGEHSWLPFHAAGVLLHADEFAAARHALDGALAVARRRGSAFSFALASAFLSSVASLTGDLDRADAEARGAVQVAFEHDLGWLVGMSVAYLAAAELERGDADAAAATLERAGFGDAVPESFPLSHFRLVRARVRIARGDARGGVAELRELGEQLTKLGVRNVSELPWRSAAATALRTLGAPDEARSLAAEELARARAWGAPRALAAALRTVAVVASDDEATALLSEAVAVLDESPARLERAHALAALGAALRRANRRADAREPLAEALELARACAAPRLEEEVRTELVATGARPRRVERTGAAALTPSERRVADRAASGQTNREIAQALFVTPRTVELHLSNAYRKLGITARSQLPAALRG